MSNKIEPSPQSVEYKTIKVGAERACFSASLGRLATTSAFGQSARGAFGPINAALKGLDSIKDCELSDTARRKIERTCNELEAFGKRLCKIYTEAADRLDRADYIVRHVLSLKDEFNVKTD